MVFSMTIVETSDSDISSRLAGRVTKGFNDRYQLLTGGKGGFFNDGVSEVPRAPRGYLSLFGQNVSAVVPTQRHPGQAFFPRNHH